MGGGGGGGATAVGGNGVSTHGPAVMVEQVQQLQLQQVQ